MENTYIFDKELSLKEKGLLTILLNLPKDFKITQETLMTLTNDGKTSVKSTLAGLCDKGYLLIEKTHVGRIDYKYTAEMTPKFLR